MQRGSLSILSFLEKHLSLPRWLAVVVEELRENIHKKNTREKRSFSTVFRKRTSKRTSILFVFSFFNNKRQKPRLYIFKIISVSRESKQKEVYFLFAMKCVNDICVYVCVFVYDAVCD